MFSRYLLLLVLSLAFQYSVGQRKEAAKKNKKSFPLKIDSASKITMYTAKVYFTVSNLPYPKAFTCSGSDLGLLMKTIDSASHGSDVIFENLYGHYANGSSKKIDTIPYNFNRRNKVAYPANPQVEEITKLLRLHYISGTIYFAGEGYINPVAVAATDSLKLQNVFAFCKPGSTVIIDNCIYLDSLKQKSKPVNKSIKINLQ